MQVSLPVRWGGLGLRSATDLAPSCFLSSLSAINGLLQTFLSPNILIASDGGKGPAIERWRALGGTVRRHPKARPHRKYGNGPHLREPFSILFLLTPAIQAEHAYWPAELQVLNHGSMQFRPATRSLHLSLM